MALEAEDPDVGGRRKRRRRVNNGRFSAGDQVEVKSEEDGFHGSWHPGTVIKCVRGVCHVRYNNFVIKDGLSRHLIGKIKVSAFTDGSSECGDENRYDYSKLLRPRPPQLEVGVWNLNYGLCVDVWHMDAWWEGVVFDLEDGAKERRIFFPDLGDEMIVQINAIRITQDWSEVSGTWKHRGTWLFLELLEDESFILPASVKQVWYDVRLKEGFQKIGQWTSTEKDLWMELIKEVIDEHLSIFSRFVMQPMPEIAESECALAPVTTVISSNGQREFVKWQPVNPDIVPGAKFCPDAVTGYAATSSTGNRKVQSSLKTNVRMHLLYLGWKIEFMRDNASLNNIPRFRYISPDGKMHYSLVQVCLALNGSTLELEIPTSNTQDDPMGLIALPDDQLPSSLDVDFQENENRDSFSSPEAIREYCHNYAAHRGNTEIKQKVKKQLLSMGWERHQVPKMVSGKLRFAYHYYSPSGKWFYSLRTACESFLDEEGVGSKRRRQVGLQLCLSEDQICLPKLKRRKVSGALIKIGDASPSSPTREMRSSKRVRQMVPPSSTHNIPQTTLSWLIDNNAVLPRAKVIYRSRRDLCQLEMAEGRITRKGIQCRCCQEVFTPSKFAVHAGNGSSDDCASANIFLKDGSSLLDCQKQVINKINITRVVHDKKKGTRFQGENDDLCTVCHYGGDLVLCDACPSAFHMSCLGLEDIPDGDWFCQSCCCRICQQCVLKADTEHHVDDTVNDIFNCDQCHTRYDLGCLMTQKIATTKRIPGDRWFCSKKCGEIFNGLHKLIGKSIPVGVENLTWTLLKPTQLDAHASGAYVEALTEIYRKLQVAVRVMHECFEPVKDPHTKRDLVEDVIFNRESELNRLNFQGFYTVLLERNDELITVAVVRVHGEKVAELPLIGTRFCHRRNGMCRILMNELEKRLEEVGVERLILPAVPSVLNTWTSSFGFSRMTKSERLQFLGFTFLDFQDTFMCQKLLRKESSPESSRVMPKSHGDVNGINVSSAVSGVFQADDTEGLTLERGVDEYTHKNFIDGCKGKEKREIPILKCYQRRRRWADRDALSTYIEKPKQAQ